MEIENIPLAEVIPYDKNPRKNDKAVDIVAKSIQAFGFKVPIILDKNNIIVAGHTRVKAAMKLGLQEVPVIWADDLTDEQIKAFRIMDNKSSEYATWDMDLLKDELIDLKGLNFDLNLTGLTEVELDKLIPTDMAEEEELDVTKPKYDIQKAEVWQLGNHRLMCGDSTNVGAISALMGEIKADMIFTDPPYGVDYTGKTSDQLKIQNDKTTDIFDQAIDVIPSKPGASFYVCCPAGNNFKDFILSFEKKCYQSSTIIWVKNSLVLGHGDYHYMHEPILYGWDKRGTHNFYGDRSQTTVWAIDRPSASKEHPTMKPIELCKKAIINSSKPEDVIFDGFGGSGSTMMACEQLNRKCYMVELDPKYCSVIIERWERLTGKKAVKV